MARGCGPGWLVVWAALADQDAVEGPRRLAARCCCCAQPTLDSPPPFCRPTTTSSPPPPLPLVAILLVLGSERGIFQLPPMAASSLVEADPNALSSWVTRTRGDVPPPLVVSFARPLGLYAGQLAERARKARARGTAK